MNKFKDSEFNENSYVKVNERLNEFWSKYPNGRINTFVESNQDGLLVRAVICKDPNDGQEYGLTGLASATGHAFLPSELLGEKVLEYTETVAIGRALAILGFKIEKSIASADEMSRFKQNKEELLTKTTEADVAGAEGQPDAPAKLKTTSRFNMSKFKKNES